MEIPGDFGLEFLDLSDVDEYERNRVLSSLQPSHPTARFPWFIGDREANIEGIKTAKPLSNRQPQPTINNDNYAPTLNKASRSVPPVNAENGLVLPINNIVEPGSGNPGLIPSTPVNGSGNPQIGSQYYSLPQFYGSPSVVTTIPSVPVHIAPANYVNYSPNTNHTEIPPNPNMYPSYIPPPTFPVKAPVFYGVPPAQPLFVPHPSTAEVGNYYQNNTSQYMVNTVPMDIKLPDDEQWQTEDSMEAPTLDQTILSKKATASLSAETPAFTPKSQQVETQENAIAMEVQKPFLEPQNEDIAVGNPDSVASDQPDKQNATPKQSGVWGAGKSWASLFTPKEGAVGGSEINGIAKTTFSEGVNKESNNNDFACPIKNPKRNHFIDPDCYRMGEFLTKYTVDGRTISLQPKGLINQSNYCYINSILQALIACPPMYNLLSGLAENISSNAKRKPTPVIDGMCKFVKEYKHLPANMRVSNRRSEGGKKDQKKDQGVMINTDIPFEPSWIYKILHGLQTDLVEGRQEDAEEFLGCLLNNLSDEMLELIKLIEASEKPPVQESEDDEDMWQVMGGKNKVSVLRKTEFERTPITDIFGGSLKSRIQRMGGLSTENTQPFLTLPLNIEKVKTVREALEVLTTKYQLEGLTSSKTNEQVEAWQQVMLDELPVVLVLHLKCFDFKLDGCTKIVKALEFPIDLKIDTKLLSSKTTTPKEKQYKLFAVVYHDGKEATKGHYITDAFHVGYSSWLRYDDASVKPVQEEQVLNPQGTRVPYLLFYRRSDTIKR